MLIPALLLTAHLATVRAHPHPNPHRLGEIHRRQDHQIVIVVPDACWWGAPGAEQQLGVCSEDGKRYDITQVYTTKTSSQANFIFGGLHQSGTAELPDGTVTMVPDDVMSCTAGWVINPTADGTFTMPPSATTHYKSLITSGGAYFACGTDCPMALPMSSAPSSEPRSSTSAGPSASGGASSGTGSSTSPQSASSASASASVTSPPDACHPARRGIHGRAKPCSSISAIGNDQPEGQVCLTLPDPQISVHPHTAIVGDWNAAGPFAHLFSFHAWVPTYLNETFDLAVIGDDQKFTSKTACHWLVSQTGRYRGRHVYPGDHLAVG